MIFNLVDPEILDIAIVLEILRASGAPECQGDAASHAMRQTKSKLRKLREKHET